MQYRVVNGCGKDIYTAIRELENKVNQFYSNNWKPQGGISIALHPYDYASDTFYVSQAMIRED